ncbi:MAG: protein translocase subunit SecDF, partial [Bacteroidia bacterium]|nr:protein translocase subunit SecDF [Bacteroidia bacterium]
MKNKNLIITLLVIFGAICAYNIFYTVKRISMDNELSSMTPEQRREWQKNKENTDAYKVATANSMGLGLDLQGGMYVTLEIGVEDVIRGMAIDPQDPVLNKALEAAIKRKKDVDGNFVDLFVNALKQADPNIKLASMFASRATGLSITASDSEVIRKLNEEADGAIERTFKIIRLRIDQFGVASPNVQLQEGSNRIIVELPGVKDAERVKKLLRGTAKLEFWPTYTVEEAFPYIDKINEKMKELKGLKVASDSTKKDSTTAADTSQTKSKKDITEVIPGQSKKDSSAKADSALTQDEKRQKFMKENPFYAVLSPPDFRNMNAKSPVVGYALIADTAEVNRMMRIPEVAALIPDDMRFLWTAKPEIENVLTLIAIKTNRDRVAPLEGDKIEDARQDFDDQNKSEAIVSMSMKPEGARIWKKMTTDNLNKSIAIVLDDYVYSYPVVNSVIPNGQSKIEGNFTIEEAKDLANLLKAGKLPAPARIEGDEIIGPTLGSETISKGMISFILGFIVVIIFMVAYYRGSGIVADIALLVNLFFLLGISSATQITLTLPGIA